MKLETDKKLVRDNLSSRGPKNVRYFMDGLVVPSSDYIPIYVYNCVIFRARVSTWKTIIGDTVFSAFLKFCSLISSLSSTFFVYKDMHIIYHFKAFEKTFRWTLTQVAIFQTLFSPLWKTVETSIGPFLWE